jgi:hypothetical protein
VTVRATLVPVTLLLVLAGCGGGAISPTTTDGSAPGSDGAPGTPDGGADAPAVEAGPGEVDAAAPDDGSPGATDGAPGPNDGAPGASDGPVVTDTCDGQSVRHIAPAAAGSGDGTSEANAGTMAQLDDFIQAVGPGGQVCVHAGDYGVGFTVTHGGTPAAPVTVKGVGRRARAASATSRGRRTTS